MRTISVRSDLSFRKPQQHYLEVKSERDGFLFSVTTSDLIGGIKQLRGHLKQYKEETPTQEQEHLGLGSLICVAGAKRGIRALAYEFDPELAAQTA